MKTLTREINFGKAVARLTVTSFTEKKYSDGIDIGVEDVITTTEVEIIAGGKVVTKDINASVLEYNDMTDTLFEKAGWDKNKVYTKVGKATTEGAKIGNEINQAINEMKEELATEFGTKTEKQEEIEEAIEIAKEVVEQAEKEGVDNLMTTKELKVWRRKYNDINNEGSEGYIPIRVSREQYENAMIKLKGVED